MFDLQLLVLVKMSAKSRCSFQMSCGVGTQTERQHQPGAKDEERRSVEFEFWGSWRSPEMEEKMNE